MMLWKREKRTVEVDGKTIELQPKPKRAFGFSPGPKPQQQAGQMGLGAQASPQPIPQLQGQQRVQLGNTDFKRPTKFKLYIEHLGAKHRGLEAALIEQGVKGSIYEFIRRMVMASIMLAVAMAFALTMIFSKLGMPIATSAPLGIAIGVAIFYIALQNFLNYPTQKGKRAAKLIDRDILFASRDLIISLRSGMPLFNAITSISTGYGEASKEFAKIVQKVQLGSPLVDAIDEVIEVSKSASFKRLMLQASVSIKSGADVVEALKSIIDELTQERTIELRRYGQKLNAIAMFYMLFGIIFPSMGIAVVTILTTFIAIFSIDFTTLAVALVGLVFLQIVFLQLIRSSRPVFTM